MAFIIGAGALALVAVARNTDKLPDALLLTWRSWRLLHRRPHRSPQAGAWGRPVDPAARRVAERLGVAAIYRLDPEDIGPAQVTWTCVGLACFIVTLLIVRDYKILARYKYVFGFLGVGLLLLPITPFGKDDQRSSPVGGLRLIQFQPGELAKICLVIFFAAYLAERKELLAIASRKVAEHPRPRHQTLRPPPGDVGHVAGGHVLREGSGLEPPVLLDLPRHDVHRDRTAGVCRRWACPLFVAGGAYIGYQTFSHVQDARLGLARRLRSAVHQRRGIPIGSIDVRSRDRRAVRNGVGSGPTRPDPGSRDRLHLLGPR